jgi:hypothetical protein
MMSNHGIHSVSIEEVMIQILVILVFANLDFHKYIWYLLSVKKQNGHNLVFFYP